MLFVWGFLTAFAIVAGLSVARWRFHGRDPRYLDDDSILLAGPPDGMTAAVATIIDGGPAATAFMAALLDLASRGEIAFRDESPRARTAHRIGIEVHGGPSEDPRVGLNRRRPIGEGETWLLGAIRTWAAGGRKGFDVEDRRELLAEAVASTWGAAAGGSSAGGVAGPPGGGLPGLEAAILDRAMTSSHPALVPLMHEAMADPDAVLADPAAFAARVAVVSGARGDGGPRRRPRRSRRVRGARGGRVRRAPVHRGHDEARLLPQGAQGCRRSCRHTRSRSGG
jgi:hypothetical protein